MMYIQIQNLTKYYYEKLILDDISFEIHSGDRIGLIGCNGSGKSTLIKILLKEDKEYHGMVTIKEGLKVGYLRQNHLEANSEISAGDEFLIEYPAWKTTRDELEKMYKKMAKNKSDEELLKRYTEIYENFESLGGYEFQSVAELLFTQIGFDLKQWDQPYRLLSGGEKTRLVLGRVFLGEPKLLILDEPTNHIDIETMEWLIKILNNYKGVILLVSHDRYFLDQTVNKVIELEDKKIKLYPGNYSVYRQEKDLEFQTKQRLYEQKRKEKKRLEKLIKVQKEWFKKAHDAAGQNDHLRRKAKKMAKRAKATESRVSKLLDSKLESPKKDYILKFDFGQTSKIGKDLISFIDVDFAYPNSEKLFENLSFHVQRGDHIGLIGANGTGKSTLLKLMLGYLYPTKGNIYVSQNLQIGYFSQELEAIEQNLSPSEILVKSGLPASEAYTLLGSFQLTGDKIFGPLKNLSLGEQMRVVLAKIMIINPDILILDEPTNHLDIMGKVSLESALKQYPGTFLIISHDRTLIQQLSEKLLIFDKDKVVFYHGGFTEYNDTEKYLDIEENFLLQLKLAEVSAKLSDQKLNEEESKRLATECTIIQQNLNK